MKNEYKHFNPKKYDIDVKIATVRTGNHCKYIPPTNQNV